MPHGVCSLRVSLQCGCPLVCTEYIAVWVSSGVRSIRGSLTFGFQWCVKYRCKFAVWVSNGVCSIAVSLQCGCPMVFVVNLDVCSVCVQW